MSPPYSCIPIPSKVDILSPSYSSSQYSVSALDEVGGKSRGLYLDVLNLSYMLTFKWRCRVDKRLYKSGVQGKYSGWVINIYGINSHKTRWDQQKKGINRKECGVTSKRDAQEVEENQVNVIPGSQVNIVFTGREGSGTPLQYSCLEKSHGRRSLVGCSPWGH